MKFIYALFGFIFFGIGTAGVILPMMPGTLFLLLALFFFTKSSDRLRNCFLQSEIYNSHLKSFIEQRALSKKSKLRILCFTTLMLSVGFYFAPGFIVKCVIVIALLIKYWTFFFWIKTLEE